MSTTPRPELEMLMRYHDGDLSDVERAQVDAGLAAHPDARAELEELSLIGDVLRETVDESAQAYDPARIWAAIEPRLSADAPAAAPADAEESPAGPGLLQGLLDWLTPPRLLPIGTLAAAAVAWMVLSTPDPAPPTAPGAAPTEVAKPAKPKPPKTAIAEAEAPKPDQGPANEVIVDAVESEDEVFIGRTAGDETATVIWLFAEADTEAPE